ncbi:aminotransferase class I/II-fold pyridoxal phosphate-dependent enzyme [Gordonia sp. SID5947]|uniref:pyridoxal phosphate-dependent aminotransferase n=1 Tax=Gordonia sp. SID5947 TaxID=2690315 RepID=UPI001371305B|nr:aminotransferase class I/II-fold pyridoxal phosphate-dependent enzyme [Gordonia sp. SID5947]MYR06514.1 aminotransferase class I/II-fold pyridoxal phosphate-dependent enzyme [Gordonia sp. SID5947]
MSPPLEPDAQPWPLARLDLNESAYAPLPAVAAVLGDVMAEANRYPDFLPDRTRADIAGHLGVPARQVTVGAGATGVALSALQVCAQRAVAAGIRRPALVTALPTFDGYPILAEMVGLRVHGVPLAGDGSVDLDLLRAAVTDEVVAVVVCSPHNPTGSSVAPQALYEFIDALPPHVLTVVDQAYVEFCDNPPDLHLLVDVRDDVLALRTFSKAYGLAALRVGYGIGDVGVVSQVRRHEVPFAVGPAAMAAVPVALAAEAELAQRVRLMKSERRRLADMLAAIGCPTLPSQANFLFLPGPEGVAIGRLLRSCGVATKECEGHGMRITIGDRAGTDYVVQALRLTALTA